MISGKKYTIKVSKASSFCPVPVNLNWYIYFDKSPKPYERWTLKGMLDLGNELKVAEEFWDFLGNEGTYSELLNCFEKTGIELRPEIDAYFSKFK